MKYLEDAKRICKVRLLAVQFQLANPCCIGVIPYKDHDTQSLTVCLYVDTDGYGIPPHVESKAKKTFLNCEIKCVDLQRRPLCAIISRLPSGRRKKGKDILELSRKIEKNLHVFESRLNVTAVCASYKVADAEEKETPCVTVFVLEKGKIPASETEIEKIKDDHRVFENTEFDVLEGYYRPALYPHDLKEYASPLHSGVGIGVKGVRGAGTLGGFFVDDKEVKNKKCYICSNDHVLNPLSSDGSPCELVLGAETSAGLEEEGKSTSDDSLKCKEELTKIIEQPAGEDYTKMCQPASAWLEKNKDKIPEKSDSSQASACDKDYEDYMERKRRNFLLEKKKNEVTISSRPRRIGKYSDGLKSNVEISCDNNTCKYYVDVAIAKLDNREVKVLTWEENENNTNNCVVNGFNMVKGVVPSGEILSPEAFVKEIRLQDPDEEPEEVLTFWKIGRETGFTKKGRIDTSFQKLFVKRLYFPEEQPCASAMAHTPIQYCTSCRPLNISETKLVKHEIDNQQVCAICEKKLNNIEAYTFWEHNCFIIRVPGEIFAKPGDSGSLIFDNRGRAWGLLHGIFIDRNNIYTLASPLSVALKALEQKCGKKLKLWCGEPAISDSEESKCEEPGANETEGSK